MIIALLALAFAMIVGGLLTAFFGWDIVLIERGWTMVIAGTFSAACGALLLGITAAVSKLARIQSELARLRIASGETGRSDASPSSAGIAAASLAGGLLGGSTVSRSEGKEQEEAQPNLPLFAREDTPADEGRERKGDADAAAATGERLPPFPPVTSATGIEHGDGEEIEGKVPDFLLAERRSETNGDIYDTPADATLFAEEPKLDEPEDELPEERARDAEREPPAESAPALEAEPAASRDEPDAAEDADREKTPDETPGGPATIIGTYNSGDNTYVMFSDGSIEAQTPKGLFRFQSLDELKAFIASGGEGGSTPT